MRQTILCIVDNFVTIFGTFKGSTVMTLWHYTNLCYYDYTSFSVIKNRTIKRSFCRSNLKRHRQTDRQTDVASVSLCDWCECNVYSQWRHPTSPLRNCFAWFVVLQSISSVSAGMKDSSHHSTHVTSPHQNWTKLSDENGRWVMESLSQSCVTGGAVTGVASVQPTLSRIHRSVHVPATFCLTGT